jgi:adenine/guanine phosphoribosyltransferase-like PRPP-binding protein
MNHTPDYDHATHFRIALRPEEISKLLPSLVAILKKFEFDAIAFMGMSGSLLAQPIAMKLKKNLIMVRKTTRGVHSSRLVEGDRASRRYIIVDDLVDSGDTARKIMKRIKRWSESECLGVLEVNKVADEGQVELTQIFI